MRHTPALLHAAAALICATRRDADAVIIRLRAPCRPPRRSQRQRRRRDIAADSRRRYAALSHFALRMILHTMPYFARHLRYAEAWRHCLLRCQLCHCHCYCCFR